MATVLELLPKVVTPVEERVVKAPVPGVVAPTLTKLAAPAVVILQLSSARETLVEELEPMVMVLATASVPMVMVLAVVPPSPMWMVSALVPVPILIVLVTLVLPRLRVVAALARLKVEEVVVISPPLTARSSARVSRPAVVTEKLVKLIKLVPAVVPERMVSHPVPTLMAVSVAAVPVRAPILIPFKVTSASPVVGAMLMMLAVLVPPVALPMVGVILRP